MLDKIKENKLVVGIIVGLLAALAIAIGLFLSGNNSEDTGDITDKVDNQNTGITTPDVVDKVDVIKFTPEQFEANLNSVFKKAEWDITGGQAKSVEVYVDGSIEGAMLAEDVPVADRKYTMNKTYNFTIVPTDLRYYGDESLKISSSLGYYNDFNMPNSLTLSVSYTDETIVPEIEKYLFNVIQLTMGDDVEDKAKSLGSGSYESETMEDEGRTVTISKSISNLGYEQGHYNLSYAINYSTKESVVETLNDYIRTNHDTTELSNIYMYCLGDSPNRFETRLSSMYGENTNTKIRYLYEDYYTMGNFDYAQLTSVFDSRLSNGRFVETKINTTTKTDAAGKSDEYLDIQIKFTDTTKAGVLYKTEKLIEAMFNNQVMLDQMIEDTVVSTVIEPMADTSDTQLYGLPANLTINFAEVTKDEEKFIEATVVIESVDKKALEYSSEETYFEKENFDEDGNLLDENGNIIVEEIDYESSTNRLIEEEAEKYPEMQEAWENGTYNDRKWD